MRMMRVSPPLLARECPGPYASTSATRFPRFARCQAVHAPNTPAPITAMSYVFCPLMPPILIDDGDVHNIRPNLGFGLVNVSHELRTRESMPDSLNGDTMQRFAYPLFGGCRELIPALSRFASSVSHPTYLDRDSHIRPTSRSQNLRRHGLAPDRPLPGRPRAGRHWCAQPAQHLLLRSDRRRRLENYRRRPYLGSALRQAARLFHRRHCRCGF